MRPREDTTPMSDPTFDALLDQIRHTHAGDPWYGTPRTRFLDGLDAERAAHRPYGSPHSIWELVLHMTSWTNEVRRRLGGAAPALPSEGDWPAIVEVSEAAWSRAKDALAAAHAALVSDAERLTPQDLARNIGDQRDAPLGAGVNQARMLVGLAQHDAYHIGQLALVRRLLDAESARAT
jgi:uncharacterized damage-inducible protein DinB